MGRAAKEMNPNLWRGRPVTKGDPRWALSVAKTRGFAFEGTRESTMLIPLAEVLNHNMVASVRTATLAEDPLLTPCTMRFEVESVVIWLH
ncbi:setd3 [Symbiodinium sp. KB8]|nr:setd3 [Symbiodinium sp. KB8]